MPVREAQGEGLRRVRQGAEAQAEARDVHDDGRGRVVVVVVVVDVVVVVGVGLGREGRRWRRRGEEERLRGVDALGDVAVRLAASADRAVG